MFYRVKLRIQTLARDGQTLTAETFYYNEGYIFIDSGNFEGIMTSDYISGTISEKLLEFKVITYPDVDYFNFSDEFDLIELPGSYKVAGNTEARLSEIIFEERIIDTKFMKRVKMDLEEMKSMLNIP